MPDKMIRNKKNKIRVYKTIKEMNEAAAELLIDVAKKSVEKRGRFSLCLSGGNTPKGLYTLLASPTYRNFMPWKNTFIFWGDERCVPANNKNNNAFMATTVLLNNVDIPPANIFPVPVQLPPAQAAKKYEKTLRNFFGDEAPRFDFILLGLGDNGHTASLFPETAVLHEDIRWVKEVFIDDLNMYRITMTAKFINRARYVSFMVTGEEKAIMLNTVLTGSYLPEQYPAQLIGPSRGEIYWFIDSKAAKLLDESR
jgi:6-phosphogluconolactonase